MRNVKTASHPENATVHKLLDARSHKGCIVAGSSPVLTTLIKLVYEQPMRWDALIRNGSQVMEGIRNAGC
jgi:hypothetical protein